MSILDIKKPPAIKQARLVRFPGGEQGMRQTMTTDERTRVQRQLNIAYGRRRRAEGRGTSGS